MKKPLPGPSSPYCRAKIKAPVSTRSLPVCGRLKSLEDGRSSAGKGRTPARRSPGNFAASTGEVRSAHFRKPRSDFSVILHRGKGLYLINKRFMWYNRFEMRNLLLQQSWSSLRLTQTGGYQITEECLLLTSITHGGNVRPGSFSSRYPLRSAWGRMKWA